MKAAQVQALSSERHEVIYVGSRFHSHIDDQLLVYLKRGYSIETVSFILGVRPAVTRSLLKRLKKRIKGI